MSHTMSLESNRVANDVLLGIFSCVPEDCSEVRLSVRVIFMSNSFTLTGYLYFGGDRIWQRFEAQEDQVGISTEVLRATAGRFGWAMGERPTKRSSLEFLYTFTPQPAGHEYKLESQRADVVERRMRSASIDRMFADALGYRDGQ